MWNNPAPTTVYQNLDIRLYNAEVASIDLIASCQPKIDALVTSYIMRAFAAVGFGREIVVDAPQFSQQLQSRGVAGAKMYWLPLLAQIARDNGCAVENTDHLKSELRRALGFYDIELTLIERCGEALDSLITAEGTTGIIPLLFQDDLMQKWYTDSATFRIFNALGRDAIRYCTAANDGQPLNVLEVGTGTGGLTVHLLDEFDETRTRYVFTDVGAYFLRAGKRRFSRYPFVEFKVFDLERPPEEQGFGPGSFDMVIANNVIHDTKNLYETLRNVASLLAPGGLLLMVELTDPQIWWHMCFGSLEGWWRFKQDPSDFRSDLMLLRKDEWLSLLAETGFAETATLSDHLPRAFANRLFLSQLA